MSYPPPTQNNTPPPSPPSHRASDRASTLEALFLSKAHKFQLDIWRKEEKALRWRLGRKEVNKSNTQNEVYQLFALYFVFQGVIFTGVAQASALTCSNWWSPVSLSLIASLATIFAMLHKLRTSSNFEKELLREKRRSDALFIKINQLQDDGTRYKLNDFSNEPSISDLPAYEYPTRFHKILFEYVFTYGGAVTFTLIVFSTVIMVSCYKILCRHCTC